MKGWAIFDRSRVYINVGYPTEEAARLELSALLQPYPEGHEWRKRLRVKYAESPSLHKRGEPMYGWRWKSDSSHGEQQVPWRKEQRIIQLVKKLNSGGWSSKEIVKSLTSRGFTPRHGATWSVELVEQIVREYK